MRVVCENGQACILHILFYTISLVLLSNPLSRHFQTDSHWDETPLRKTIWFTLCRCLWFKLTLADLEECFENLSFVSLLKLLKQNLKMSVAFNMLLLIEFIMMDMKLFMIQVLGIICLLYYTNYSYLSIISFKWGLYTMVCEEISH